MAKTITSAFKIFNENFVNLDTERTKKARCSRDWLVDRLNKLPVLYENFPLKYEERHMKFGSFARNTKIRELDDIDLMFCLHGNNATYSKSESDDSYNVFTTNAGQRLKNLSDNNILNSRKVLNQLVTSLSEIEHYSSAEIHRQQEAVTLKLLSYEWNFDIVPAFFTDTNLYLIPDGNGNWKLTNPSIDQENVTRINKKHNNNILQIVRTLKYWNRKAKMPTIGSYMFENMILNYFDTQENISDDIDVNLIKFWKYLKSEIFNNVPDPKGIQSDLNNLTNDERTNVSNKTNDTYVKSKDAYTFKYYELNEKKSINKWREIFGENFPEYE